MGIAGIKSIRPQVNPCQIKYGYRGKRLLQPILIYINDRSAWRPTFIQYYLYFRKKAVQPLVHFTKWAGEISGFRSETDTLKSFRKNRIYWIFLGVFLSIFMCLVRALSEFWYYIWKYYSTPILLTVHTVEAPGNKLYFHVRWFSVTHPAMEHVI